MPGYRPEADSQPNAKTKLTLAHRIGLRPEPRETGPVRHCGHEYLLHPFLGLRESQVNEALAFRQISVVHDAKQDTCYLNATCYRDHLGVDGKRDVRHQLLGEGAGGVISAKRGRPSRTASR